MMMIFELGSKNKFVSKQREREKEKINKSV